MRLWNVMGQRPGPSGWARVVTKSYQMPDGSQSDWDVIVADDAVAVVAVTGSDAVVLARQYRPGPDRVLDELPGGEIGARGELSETVERQVEMEPPVVG